MKSPSLPILSALLCALVLGSCNDRILPADEEVWTSQKVIFTQAPVLGFAEGPIVTMALNSQLPDPAIANGVLLYPPQAGRIIYSMEDYDYNTTIRIAGSDIGDQVVAQDIPPYVDVEPIAALTFDGNAVAYVQNEWDGTRSLNFHEVDGSPVTNPVLSDIGEVTGLLFSDDGVYLAMNTSRYGGPEKVEIYDRSNWQLITTVSNIISHSLDVVVDTLQVNWYQWNRSLNNPGIIYAGWDTYGNRGLYLASASGVAPRKIADGDFTYPSPSPDGTRIAFIRENNLWLIDADGNGEEQLTTLVHNPDDREAMIAPLWSPDGSKVMFFRLRVLQGLSSMEVVDVRTRRRKVLATNVYPGFWFN